LNSADSIPKCNRRSFDSPKNNRRSFDSPKNNRRSFAHHPQTKVRLGPRSLRMTAQFVCELWSHHSAASLTGGRDAGEGRARIEEGVSTFEGLAGGRHLQYSSAAFAGALVHFSYVDCILGFIERGCDAGAEGGAVCAGVELCGGGAAQLSIREPAGDLHLPHCRHMAWVHDHVPGCGLPLLDGLVRGSASEDSGSGPAEGADCGCSLCGGDCGWNLWNVQCALGAGEAADGVTSRAATGVEGPNGAGGKRHAPRAYQPHSVLQKDCGARRGVEAGHCPKPRRWRLR